MANPMAINEAHNAPARSDTDVEPLSSEEIPERERSGVEGEGEGRRDPNIVDFDGPNDPEHPLNWSTARKTTSIAIVSMTALLS